jgi:hypothetical protein
MLRTLSIQDLLPDALGVSLRDSHSSQRKACSISLRPAILFYAKPRPWALSELATSMCVLSLHERNLGGDIGPLLRFSVDRRCASEQPEWSATSAQSEASGRCFVGFEADSPISDVNAEHVAIQGQLQE